MRPPLLRGTCVAGVEGDSSTGVEGRRPRGDFSMGVECDICSTRVEGRRAEPFATCVSMER